MNLTEAVRQLDEIGRIFIKEKNKIREINQKHQALPGVKISNSYNPED